MEIRLYCGECKEEIGYLPMAEEGQISLEIIQHECKATQATTEALFDDIMNYVRENLVDDYEERFERFLSERLGRS